MQGAEAAREDRTCGDVRLLRPLGHMERYQLSKHLRRSAGPVVVAATLRGLPKGAAAEPQPDRSAYWHGVLVPALASLCAHHPQLSLAVVPEHRSGSGPDDVDAPPATPWFAGLTQAFGVEDVVTCDLEAAHWDTDVLARALSEEVQRDFDVVADLQARTAAGQRPLWRVRVMWHQDRPDECCLCFVWDHVLADGLSGKLLLRDLISRLPAVAAAAECDLNKIAPFDFDKSAGADSLPAPYDQRQPPAPSASTIAKVMANERSPPYWAGQAAPSPDATHHTRIALASVSPALCASLQSEGKRRAVSLHAILFTACATALRSIFAVPATVGIKASTPVSARRFCEPPIGADEVGNFIGSVETWLPAPASDSDSNAADAQEAFWASCADYGTHLSANLREGAALPALFAYVGAWPEAWEGLWRAKGDRNEDSLRRAGSLELSDLGLWEDGAASARRAGSEWQVTEVTFGQSAHVNGEALLCSVARCAESGLRMAVAWQDGTLDEADARRFASEFEAVLARTLTTA